MSIRPLNSERNTFQQSKNVKQILDHRTLHSTNTSHAEKMAVKNLRLLQTQGKTGRKIKYTFTSSQN